jgi:hypothetical protein
LDNVLTKLSHSVIIIRNNNNNAEDNIPRGVDYQVRDERHEPLWSLYRVNLSEAHRAKIEASLHQRETRAARLRDYLDAHVPAAGDTLQADDDDHDAAMTTAVDQLMDDELAADEAIDEQLAADADAANVVDDAAAASVDNTDNNNDNNNVDDTKST